ncbi:protein maelstrom 2-like [Adelges cooleyi]|uniref:protein maelstrom 2-like n=1 Tax=Adelges cooleyi TaxID=133065 RepID=UPI00217F559B|nr:protein maelstrom 2-like [Adelges cooleyi]
MAPKKNPFGAFLMYHKAEAEKKQGRKSITMSELATELAPIWSSMTNEDKQYFKNLADKMNRTERTARSKNIPENIKKMHENSTEYWMMQKYIEKMFQFITDEKELLDKKFILLHVNSHTHSSEHYYFPAEIAAIEFTLKNGVSRTYYQMVGVSKIYPRGYGGGMREYSDTFHRISCWEDHPDDHKKILLEFLSFLKDGTVEVRELEEGTLDLPYMYIMESEVGSNMMNAKSSLEKLYETVFPNNAPKSCKSLFKMGSLERLFHEIIKKFNIHLNRMFIDSGFQLSTHLESDMYGHGLGCSYHEERDIAYKCSKARVLRWMSNICTFLKKYGKVEIVPGRNVAIMLRDGSRLIIEDEDIPLTRKQIGMKSIAESYNYNSADYD